MAGRTRADAHVLRTKNPWDIMGLAYDTAALGWLKSDSGGL